MTEKVFRLRWDLPTGKYLIFKSFDLYVFGTSLDKYRLRR